MRDERLLPNHTPSLLCSFAPQLLKENAQSYTAKVVILIYKKHFERYIFALKCCFILFIQYFGVNNHSVIDIFVTLQNGALLLNVQCSFLDKTVI